MSGKLDLRNDFHSSHRGIFHNLPYILVCIESAFTLRSLAGPCADLGQTWIFLALQTPSAVVDKMELQFVELIHSHHVNEFLDIILVIIISCGIKHHAAPRVGRSIGDSNSRHGPPHAGPAYVTIDFCRKILQKCLYAVKHTGRIVACNSHRLWRDLKRIALRRWHSSRIDHKAYMPLVSFPKRQIPSGGTGKHAAQIFCLRQQRPVI